MSRAVSENSQTICPEELQPLRNIICGRNTQKINSVNPLSESSSVVSAYSTAVDESTNILGTYQLTAFVRG